MSSEPRFPAAAPRTTLVLGGARSGKSLHAERLARDTGRPVRYIATAAHPRDDAEFAARIALHAARRPGDWTVTEAGADLAAALAAADTPAGCILLDCLTLWLSGLLCPRDGAAPLADWAMQLARFDAALRATRGVVIVVSNEIGLGVVPMGALTRHYVDELGRLNQRVAACCERVILSVAGLPLTIK
ncbi:bifunctional adenosylcobinamide kinase/adenosylcobinamide-phosphate guanylyltransferase [Robbsia sp. Bb-Pol-6]|uniref:Bifunctional adenosylcobalamin biosynthesis protein n=1 Tax=Robbsia betulipollinis TaxID=2981849 RepID=A0ABT3ZRI1_9BURK|nr:bifunctional adenosylcobinamide kinase/adenosylcobinamide-phosphate guanylyltransferase [Robbsia betulipollinis]MCY0389097.1 bifunctional adenosylcobinamide kinase/adenosylcobinamide-phosphate guanylyltransferase [Robbsia betulipollinis]